MEKFNKVLSWVILAMSLMILYETIRWGQVVMFSTEEYRDSSSSGIRFEPDGRIGFGSEPADRPLFVAGDAADTVLCDTFYFTVGHEWDRDSVLHVGDGSFQPPESLRVGERSSIADSDSGTMVIIHGGAFFEQPSDTLFIVSDDVLASSDTASVYGVHPFIVIEGVDVWALDFFYGPDPWPYRMRFYPFDTIKY